MERPLSDRPRHIIRFADLAQRRPTAVTLDPDAAARAAIAAELDLIDLRKLRFAVELTPHGQTDWVLRADLGATVVQPCGVTLAPVTTRIDESVQRTYTPHLDEPDGAEVEMPEDDTIEPLPATLDLADVMIEALSLALPPFPRAADVDPLSLSVTEPGKTPMTDDDARPFAGLAALRDQMDKPEGEDG